ncbi:glyceraldehyde 3-phosphate dehydrogenase NAD-binding domain-containing protein [Alkalibacterium sp. f15]
MFAKIAINGFGRVGSTFLRRLLAITTDLEFVVINDLGDVENIA